MFPACLPPSKLSLTNDDMLQAKNQKENGATVVHITKMLDHTAGFPRPRSSSDRPYSLHSVLSDVILTAP
jgi:hypothetical protein